MTEASPLYSVRPGEKHSSTHTRADIALRGIYEISKILVMPGRQEIKLANVLTLLSSFLDMHHGIVALLDDRGDPRSVVGIGWREEQAHEYYGKLPEKAVGRVVVTGMPVVVDNIANSSLFEGWIASDSDETVRRRSFIGVPIKDRDRIIGTLTIEQVWRDDSVCHAADEDVRFLTMVANLIGQTVRLMEIVGKDRERLLAAQSRLEKKLSSQSGANPAPAPAEPVVAGIVGASPALKNVLNKIRIVARSHSTVLLRGETGTGKEMFAQAVHSLSPRSEAPFIKLNCAALPETVLESELFGHEKGAFTGAVNQRKGRFELADGGTLFLDEIGDISPAFQIKLLRVLQEGEFERVGGSKTLKVNVRLVCATNVDLEEAVTQGKFRADLYYRINVVSIHLPPLRDRQEDIPLLAREFLRRFDEEHQTQHVFDESAIDVLTHCYFPGNVRELENCVRRTATLAEDGRIAADEFACRHDECLSATLWHGSVSPHFNVISRSPDNLADRRAEEPRAPDRCDPDGSSAADADPAPVNRELTRAELTAAMERAGWVQAKAARLLKLTPRQIGYALRKHGIEIKKI